MKRLKLKRKVKEDKMKKKKNENKREKKKKEGLKIFAFITNSAIS